MSASASQLRAGCQGWYQWPTMVCARGMRGVAQWGVNSVVEFGILGPVQAVRGGREVELGGPRRRALQLGKQCHALAVPAGGQFPCQ